MRHFLSIAGLFIVMFVSTAKAEIIALSGVYEGINLYVENDSIHGKACVKEVYVNDILVNCEKDKHFFEVDLSFLKVKETVSVKIICTSNCKVKILNPEAINLMYGFQFMNLVLHQDKIEWTTINEKPGGRYVIELYVQKHWISVGEVAGKPSSLVSAYDKKQETLKHMFYRIRYIDKDGVSHSSKPVKFKH